MLRSGDRWPLNVYVRLHCPVVLGVTLALIHMPEKQNTKFIIKHHLTRPKCREHTAHINSELYVLFFAQVNTKQEHVLFRLQAQPNWVCPETENTEQIKLLSQQSQTDLSGWSMASLRFSNKNLEQWHVHLGRWEKWGRSVEATIVHQVQNVEDHLKDSTLDSSQDKKHNEYN